MVELVNRLLICLEKAFENLKQAMTHAPVLSMPNFSLPFILETDACDTGISTILILEGRLLTFMSKALGVKNQRLSAYEKEYLTLIMAVKQWYPNWPQVLKVPTRLEDY